MCLDKIIGIKKPCENESQSETSLSNYYITDYPGINFQSAANTTDEKNVNGYKYLVDLRRRAMMRMQNDIIAYINQTYKVNTIASNLWRSGEYLTDVISAGAEGQSRGIVIYKQNLKCRLKKITIPRIRIYSAQTIDTTLTIKDVAGKVYSVAVSLVADVINTFEVNLKVQGDEVQITLPSDIAVYSNKPNCGVGCANSLKSDCVKTNGLNNGVTNTTQAYGIDVEIICECDLSTIMCDIATNNLIGQAAYELCGAMFYDEMAKTNRLNYLTIYKGEEIAQQAQAGFAAYRNYLQNMFLGLRNFLVNMDGGCKCVDCSGVKVKINI
mgnify:CR=1 FL=1|jgi:hypothetical protein